MTGLITTPAISSGIPVADAAQILGQARAMMQDIKTIKNIWNRQFSIIKNCWKHISNTTRCLRIISKFYERPKG